MRGIVPFDIAGPGVVLHFPVSALLALEEKYGQGVYWEKIELGIVNASTKVMVDCAAEGLRRMEGNRSVKLGLEPDDWQFHINEARMPMLDALCQGLFETDYAEQLRIASARQSMVEAAIAAEQEDKDDPLPESPESDE